MKFTRRFENAYIEALKSHPLFKERLLPDIVGKFENGKRQSPSVFPAIRNGEMHFYHRGGNLFKFRAKNKSNEFSTHHKYASALVSTAKSSYVSKRDLKACVPMSSFMDSRKSGADDFVYQRIKENCEVFAAAYAREARAVSHVYNRFSCVKQDRKDPIVVLDIEISFANRNDDDPSMVGSAKQDRIDMLLLDTRSRELRFVEAKLFSNSEIRPHGNKPPSVVEQIGRYRKQLSDEKNRVEILAQYKKYVEAMNKIFDCDLPEPIRVHSEPILYIFDFDRDQRDGALQAILERLIQKDITVYHKGGPEDVKIHALWKGDSSKKPKKKRAPVNPAIQVKEPRTANGHRTTNSDSSNSHATGTNPTATTYDGFARTAEGSVKLTIHRGSREIGGSCVELRSGESRIVLDIGMPLIKPDGGSFDIREYDGLRGEELIDRKVLPRVEGLYDWQKPSIDAVLISHAHADHYGFLNYVHRDIPIYLSAGTLKLIEITALISRKKNPLKNTLCFSWPSRFRLGDFVATPHLVDHSAFSAFAFEIESRGKRVFYSGDFRGHGHLGKAMDVLYRRVRPGMDALLMEGTTLGRDRKRMQTEQELSQEATTLCEKTEGAVFVYQSGQNISRAVSFFKAAMRSGRCFVPDIYTAYVMRELGHCPGGESLPWPGKPRFKGIKVWYPKKISSHLRRSGHANILESFRSHEIEITEVAKNLGKYMIFVRPGMEADLRGISCVDGSRLVYSLWEGYRRADKTRQFIEAVEALGISVETLHTSGHAELSSLQRMADTLKAKQLIPVHTFHPDEYSKHFKGEIRMLRDGQEIDL